MVLELLGGALSLLAASMLFHYAYVKIRTPGSTMFESDVAQNALVLSVLWLGVIGLAYPSISLL
jgi:hypothetical protein